MSELDRNDRLDPIAGKCVLVVEDDYVLAREVCNDLANHGAHILGPAPTIHYASLIIGRRQLDGAILDIKLFGEEVYDLVDQLRGRGIPIVFATAYQPEQIDARYRNIDVLSKPLDFQRLRRKVADFQPIPMSPPHPVSPPKPIYYRTPDHRPAIGVNAMGDQERWSRLLLEAMRR